MPNTYFDSDLTGAQIEAALNAIYGVVTPSNNGKVLAIEDGAIVAKSASEWTDTPVLEAVTITENGTTTPPAGVDGFNSVTVNVQGGGGSAVVQPLSVTQNGLYNPPSGVDGYAPVTVNVQGGGVSDNDLLFHFNDFTNSGKMNAAFYNKTGYLISNEQSKFGGTSLKVGDPSNHAVYIDDEFTIADQDFTLDFWAYMTYTTAAGTSFSFDYRSLAFYMPSGVKRGLALASSSGSWSHDVEPSFSLDVLNSWHHFAITRSGSTFRHFVDGNEEYTFEWSGSLAPMRRLSFGTNSNDTSYRWHGYIDEFRLKIGEAVWTSDFTPPTEPYT